MNCFLLVDTFQADTIEAKLVSLTQAALEAKAGANENEQTESEAKTAPALTLMRYQEGEQVNIPNGATVLLYLSDEQITHILPYAAQLKWQLAVLPHPDARIACKAYGVSAHLSSAIEDAMNNEVVEVDLLQCHGRPVLYSLVIGDVFGLKPGGQVEGFWRRCLYLYKSLKRLGQLIPRRFTLETHSGEKVVTAALGITVVEHGHNSVLGRRLLPDSSASDGKFHGILLSPRSVMEMTWVLLQSLFSKGKGDLPECIGLIETASLDIECAEGFRYRHDNTDICAKQLSITCEQKALSLMAGRNISLGKTKNDPKERRRIQYLPSGDAINELTAKPLRWMAHAATEDFKELYQTLRENAQPSSVFLTLMILSTVLASVGLFANSSPVIIGAMILAPLMAPIISLSMAILRQDEQLLKNSVKTLLTGLLLALFFAVLTALVIPIHTVTNEIATRIQPNLLDLAVAVISGIAGAYANAKASVAKSLAGVAIAVALVPPLAVTGIGIGWWEWSLISGAFLLFFTNLAGIVLAACLTFLVLGFAPFHLAKRGLIISLSVVGVVSIPLALSFFLMVNQRDIEEKIENIQFPQGRVVVQHMSRSTPPVISVQIVSTQSLTTQDFTQVKQRIESVVQQPVVLQIEPVLRLE